MEFEFDIDTKEHAVTLLKAVNRLRKDGKNHDIIIKVGSEEIWANKDILMAASEYFEAMFSHDTKERNSGIVEMSDVDFNSVKACIDFIYTGQTSATSEKCEQLLTVASIMQLPAITVQISKFLLASLKQETFYRTKKIAENFDLQDLGDACDKFAMENFTSIAQENDFLEMELEYICFLLESIKMKKTVEEDKKLEAIIKWIKADNSSRGEHLINIMGWINLDRITLEYIKYLAESEELCYESAKCMRMLLLSAARNLTVSEKRADALILFDLSNQKLQAYKPSTKQMKSIHSLPENVTKNKNFVAINTRGVIRTFHEDQSMYRLDTTKTGSEWRKSTSMLQGHGCWLRATLLNDDIFVTGQNSIEKYNICKDEWQMIDKSNINCDQNSIVGFQQCVYSIGGCVKGFTTKLVYKYLLTTKEWKAVCSMNKRRAIPAATCYNDKIFVAGGFSNEKLHTTEFYDAICNSWTVAARLTTPRDLFGVCVLDDKMFAVGCRIGPLSVEEYDDTETWKIIEENANMRIMAGAVCTGYFPE